MFIHAGLGLSKTLRQLQGRPTGSAQTRQRHNMKTSVTPIPTSTPTPTLPHGGGGRRRQDPRL